MENEPQTKQRFSSEISDIEVRAKRANNYGRFGIAMIIILATAYLFLVANHFDNWISDFIRAEYRTAEDPIKPADDSKLSDEEKIRKMYFEKVFENQKLIEQLDERNWWLIEIVRAMAIIALFSLCLYVIRILLMLTRYHFRLSAHLYTVADAIKIFEDEPEKLTQFIEATTPKHIGFGKDPETFYETILKNAKNIKL